MCCSSGEEGSADTERQGGQAVEGCQRSAEGAGGPRDGAGSHAAPDELDHSESEEPDRAEVRGANSARHQLHEGEQKPRT